MTGGRFILHWNQGLVNVFLLLSLDNNKQNFLLVLGTVHCETSEGLEWKSSWPLIWQGSEHPQRTCITHVEESKTRQQPKTEDFLGEKPWFPDEFVSWNLQWQYAWNHLSLGVCDAIKNHSWAGCSRVIYSSRVFDGSCVQCDLKAVKSMHQSMDICLGPVQVHTLCVKGELVQWSLTVSKISKDLDA